VRESRRGLGYAASVTVDNMSWRPEMCRSYKQEYFSPGTRLIPSYWIMRPRSAVEVCFVIVAKR
jgi:hypothetical protein